MVVNQMIVTLLEKKLRTKSLIDKLCDLNHSSIC